MSSLLYYLTTAAESVLSIAGIRAPYEQPRYEIVGRIGDTVEIRAYAARVAVETSTNGNNDSEAFGRLFRYITGANQRGDKIAMTIPVQQSPQRTGQRIAMTIPVELGGADVMRFFLPASVVQSGPPAPTDPRVHIVRLPPETFAVLRFSGFVTAASRRAHENALLAALATAHRQPDGVPSLLSYDPPFALPFVRRNEVAVKLADTSNSSP